MGGWCTPAVFTCHSFGGMGGCLTPPGESVLFIGTPFSNLYTAVDRSAKGSVGVSNSTGHSFEEWVCEVFRCLLPGLRPTPQVTLLRAGWVGSSDYVESWRVPPCSAAASRLLLTCPWTPASLPTQPPSPTSPPGRNTSSSCIRPPAGRPQTQVSGRDTLPQQVEGHFWVPVG